MAPATMTRKELEDMKSGLQSLNQALQGHRGDPRTPGRNLVTGTPHDPAATFRIRKGDSIMSSNGFRISRLMQMFASNTDPDIAKNEVEISGRLMKSLRAKNTHQLDCRYTMPISTALLGDEMITDDERMEWKSMVHAGANGAYCDEMSAIEKRYQRQLAQSRKASGITPAQSWIDSTYGGDLAGPAEQGELIQLLRNKEALVNAGARIIPLPPSGSLKLPRQTSPTQGYWLGENTNITISQFQTGAVLLRGRKCCALVVMPGELLRFASPAAEAIVREDMTKTLSLTLDLGLLQGAGSDNVPLGLATMGAASNNPYNMAIVSPANANVASPQDIYKFAAQVEANNAEMEGWIMRPELFWGFVETRGTTYSGSGQVGQFVFNQFRAAADGFDKRLNGYPVVTTPQVSNTRGTGSQTYILGGMWSDYIIAMFGAIEFMQSDQGIQLMQADQVAVVGKLTADGAPRHPGAFAFMDAINITPGA